MFRRVACKDRKPSRLDAARRVLAGLIAVALALLGIGSNYDSGLRICRPTLSTQGKVFTLCEPYEITDLAFGLPVVVLLLLPDIVMIELPGIGVIKVRSREQQQDDSKRPSLSQANAQREPVIRVFGYSHSTDIALGAEARSNTMARPTGTSCLPGTTTAELVTHWHIIGLL